MTSLFLKVLFLSCLVVFQDPETTVKRMMEVSAEDM